MGLDWNQQNNQLFVMQHGRDNLNSSWPEIYDTKESAELPAECLYALKKATMQAGHLCTMTAYNTKKL